jgi:RNA polymerase sigma-70 factor (ECF subfamily)
MTLDNATRDDLVAEVFLVIVKNDFGVLRRFRRNCSLATYLTVISRRVIVRRLHTRTHGVAAGNLSQAVARDSQPPQRMENQEEVQKLLHRLDPKEASVVRMYHLEGKSYAEISQAVGLTENSIGPVLTRARAKMRNGSE